MNSRDCSGKRGTRHACHLGTESPTGDEESDADALQKKKRKKAVQYEQPSIKMWMRIYFNSPTMFSGRTHSSNCLSVTKPSLTAMAFKVVPSLWAFWAISADL